MLGGWLSDCLRYDTEHDLDNFLKNRAFNGKPSTSIHPVSGFCQVQSDFKEFASCFSVSDSKSNFPLMSQNRKLPVTTFFHLKKVNT